MKRAFLIEKQKEKKNNSAVLLPVRTWEHWMFSINYKAIAIVDSPSSKPTMNRIQLIYE